MVFFNILTAILSIIAFLGLNGMMFVTNKNISKLMEHSFDVLFGYYSKMKVYLLELKITLGTEDNTPLLATLVDRDENSISEDDESVKKLCKVTEKIIDFFKTQDWQIPLDFDFEAKLSNLLTEIMYLEDGNFCICNSDVESVNEQHRKIISLIDELITKITTKQNEIAVKAQQSQDSLLNKIKRKR